MLAVNGQRHALCNKVIHLFRNLFHARCRAHRSVASAFWHAGYRGFWCDLLGINYPYRPMAVRSEDSVASPCDSVESQYRQSGADKMCGRYGFTPGEFREM